MTKNDLSPPKATEVDDAHAVARAVLGAIPTAGTAALEAFNALIVPPLEKRRDEWRQQIADALADVIESVEELSAENLQENDAFISAVAHASQIALRNHQDEKREALRNAVLNVAVGNAPDEDTQLMFLNFIDVLTPSHLRILKLFQAPVQFASARGKDFSHMSMGGLGHVIEIVFPELRDQREYYDLVMADLFSRGLTNTQGANATMSGTGLAAKRTTHLGDEFLGFIESPLDA